MNNKYMLSSINDVLTSSMGYLKELSDKYGFTHTVPFTIYDTRFDTRYPENLAAVRVEYDAIMVSLFIAHGDFNDKIPIDDQIVEEIHSGIFMSREQLYNVAICCELDFSKMLESMKFTLRHEVGHVLDMQRTMIGVTVGEWNLRYKQGRHEINCLSHLRKNASIKNRLNWFIEYFSIPKEKRANDCVGITRDDVIEEFYRITGVKKRVVI